MTFKLLMLCALLSFSANVLSADNLWVGSDLNGQPCKGRAPNYGPYDYSKRTSKYPANLAIVEENHFTPEVENLIKGNTSITPAGDIDYTLIAWPNHHRALLSAINYELLIRAKVVNDRLTSPPECYLKRAIHFSPKDAVSYSLFGYYLKKVGALNDAVKYYEKALDLEPNNPKFAYSFSLLLIDLKRYDEAVKYAKAAYQHRGTPDGLKNMLIKLNVWHE